MNDADCQRHAGSGMWYRRAESRLHGSWGRDRALEWLEHCAAVGWWTLLLPAKEWAWSDGMYRLHRAQPHARVLHPGAEAIVAHVLGEERERVRAELAVLDEAASVRHEDVSLEYWVPSGGAVPRRIRLVGQLEPVSGSGRISWIGCAEDITDVYLSGRAQTALAAAEDALQGWRSFASGTESLLRGLAVSLDAPVAMAWMRGGNGRLESRVQWRALAAAFDASPEPSIDSSRLSQHKSLARTVWATRAPAAAAGALGVAATWRGETVAALTFELDGVAFLDERLARSLRWVGYALGRRLTGDRPEVGEVRLSERERQVLQLAADGYDGPAIAQHLFVSPATVKTHFLHVYEKLGVNDRPAAVARALRQGLIA